MKQRRPVHTSKGTAGSSWPVFQQPAELQLEDLQADEAEAAREMPAADQAPRKKSVRRPLAK